MTESTSLNTRGRHAGLARGLGASALSLALFASQTAPVYAAITNTATANGTPAAGTLVPPTANASVNVATGAPTLTIVKTAGAPVEVGTDSVINGGDTILFTYVITNSGNVSINSVTPVDAGPQFNTINGTGTLGGFTLVSTTNAASTGATLLPGESATFTALYTLSAIDAYRAAGIAVATGNAVENTATATGSPVTGTLGTVTPSSVEVAIPAAPNLSLVKNRSITTDNGSAGVADVGDIITYTYVVQNTGNVTITGLNISDLHEGVALVTPPNGETLTSDGPLAAATPSQVSSDAVANNGSWSTIRPGATVTFTYVHTVTQAEVDAG
jgi:large repetitive protein